MATISIQVLNGLTLAMLLFLLASGLSIIFGLMRIINLAHGSFYLLGGYIGLSVINATDSFWLGLLLAPIVVGVVGMLTQRFLLQRVQHNELGQVLMSFGLLLIISDATLWWWGGLPQTLPRPEFLEGSYRLAGLVFPKYRLALTIAGVVVAISLWLLIERTRIGAIIRAGVDDADMTRATGVNIRLVFLMVFAAGAALAAAAGVLGGAMLGVYPGADFEVVLQAFAVVVIGGLGSLRGAFIGSLLIGLIDTLGKAIVPELAMFTVFVPMVAMLAIKPNGLFGRA
ncbi:MULTISPECIES: branched-chain amino acid ABC transporter permease [unclassified Beijerinckia]|uniref:branched-chain amino acid ABC transporter permease n=1 Tax=unclassified Beijerinckia TaxID=2638183 RepID=UPI0008981169|nr:MULTISPECIES: branched-chain amino acid ABC transporter permease [unclassified Beijerinckia]MDH7798886.1 branched-chain amino acid transport system permease protein [Beijerinckia sp. GAS462]SED87988.1 amino acid/amide ABC transporter membrane protein 1, HAAT family [Beijerinckia sp. 28-YEA-48]